MVNHIVLWNFKEELNVQEKEKRRSVSEWNWRRSKNSIRGRIIESGDRSA